MTLANSVEFANNPEPRCPVVLLLDTSGSMAGRPIDELNAGLKDFADSVKADALASLRVELAIITFGGTPKVIQPFVTVDNFLAPTLSAGGETPMGGAVRMALEMLRERKNTYKQNSIDYYRPWIFLISDGEPNDVGWEAAAEQAREEEARRGILFFAVGVEGANLRTLAQFSANRSPVMLRGLEFRELFKWLSKSMSAVSRSRMGDAVDLPPLSGWAQAPTQ